METLTNFFTDHGGNILLGIISFWVICAAVLFVWMPYEMKRAEDYDDGFDNFI